MDFKSGNWISVLSLILVISIMLFCQGCNDDTVCPQLETGRVRVECQPDSMAIPWSIAVPGGLVAIGAADTVLPEMPIGEYEISWGQVSGWHRIEGNYTTLNLQNDSTINFISVYEKDDSPSGSISIVPMPVSIDPGWVLNGPNGYVTDGTHGALVINYLEEGDYTLAWGGVPGWETPDPDVVEVNLTESCLLTITGVYVEKEKCLISIDPNPDSLDASWELQGPDGFLYSGHGDVTLGNLIEGDYTVIWPEVANWIAPAAEVISVLAGETAVFSGVYEIDLPLANNGNTLIGNFRYVYEEMFFAGYESILHSGHQTMVLQSTYDHWEGSDTPLTSLYLDRNLALSIHQNIFQGVDGTDNGGFPVEAIESIYISLFEQLGPWDAIPTSMEYFGDFDAHSALFSIVLTFVKGESSQFEVNQVVSFIVAEESGQYKLLGIIPMDGSGVIASELISYDEVLLLYR